MASDRGEDGKPGIPSQEAFRERLDEVFEEGDVKDRVQTAYDRLRRGNPSERDVKWLEKAGPKLGEQFAGLGEEARDAMRRSAGSRGVPIGVNIVGVLFLLNGLVLVLGAEDLTAVFTEYGSVGPVPGLVLLLLLAVLQVFAGIGLLTRDRRGYYLAVGFALAGTLILPVSSVVGQPALPLQSIASIIILVYLAMEGDIFR